MNKQEAAYTLARTCIEFAQSRKASDILLLDLTEIENAPAEYFVICTAGSDVQARAIMGSIQRGATELGLDKPRVEGYESANWIIMDFFDVVIHIFLTEARTFYKLEKLWGDAPMQLITESGESVEAVKIGIAG